MIVAIARNGVIGRSGGLPWDWPEDRRHFHDLTRGHVVVMGRRTWEEAGEPLPDRTNVVVSRSFVAPAPAITVPSLDEALRVAWEHESESALRQGDSAVRAGERGAKGIARPFVIGGVRMFEQARPLITRAYVTEIPEEPSGDVKFTFDTTGFLLVEERTTRSGLRFLTYAR